MFLEATIRFLKAKLRVMQEELDRVVAECNKKVIMVVASFSLCLRIHFLFCVKLCTSFTFDILENSSYTL